MILLLTLLLTLGALLTAPPLLAPLFVLATLFSSSALFHLLHTHLIHPHRACGTPLFFVQPTIAIDIKILEHLFTAWALIPSARRALRFAALALLLAALCLGLALLRAALCLALALLLTLKVTIAITLLRLRLRLTTLRALLGGSGTCAQSKHQGNQSK